MEDNLERSIIGTATALHPMIYDNLLTRAHARTFHLHRQIQAARPEQESDPELREVLSHTIQWTYLPIASNFLGYFPR